MTVRLFEEHEILKQKEKRVGTKPTVSSDIRKAVWVSRHEVMRNVSEGLRREYLSD